MNTQKQIWDYFTKICCGFIGPKLYGDPLKKIENYDDPKNSKTFYSNEATFLQHKIELVQVSKPKKRRTFLLKFDMFTLRVVINISNYMALNAITD